MHFSDDFTKVRVASAFMEVPLALNLLGMTGSTGSFAGDKKLIMEKIKEYHSDRNPDPDAQQKILAATALWERFIKQGKPIDVHARPQQQGRSDAYQRYYEQARPQQRDEVDEWLELHIPDFKGMIEKVQQQLVEAIEVIQSRRWYQKPRKPDWQIQNAVSFVKGMYDLIKESGHFGSEQGGPYKRQMSDMRFDFYKIYQRLTTITNNWRAFRADDISEKLQWCVYELQKSLDRYDVFATFSD